MKRRALLKGAVALGASLALSRKSVFASTADSRIEVLLDEPVGAISPAVYGHFTEMLGAVVYDGIFVGENSKIPNTAGIRKTVIEKLRQIKAPMVRWPGGCFADSYDWARGETAGAGRLLERRAQHVRLPGVHAFLSLDRRRTLLRSECSKFASSGV